MSDNFAALDSRAQARTPPHNFEAEMALLGAVLSSALAYDAVADIVTPMMFADPRHGRIFEAIASLVEAGRVATVVTLKDHFEAAGTLDSLGGGAYLASLLGAVVSIHHARDYAEAIADRWQRRQLIAAADDLAAGAYDMDLEVGPRELIERAEADMADIAAAREVGQGAIAFGTWSASAIRSIEAAYKGDRGVLGLGLGMRTLDHAFAGLRSGELLILAARPSMGKTALAERIAQLVAQAELDAALAEDRAPAAVYAASAEMSGDEWATRTLSRQSRVNSWRVRHGNINAAEMDALIAADRALTNLPLHVDDEAAITAGAIRARARRLQRRSGLKLIIVDYLQRCTPAPGGDNNRVQQVSRLARDFKTIAKQLKVPVIVLSQLSRAVEQRENKKPQLADLRESGEIEQEADIVAFLYRHKYYLERQKPPREGDSMDAWRELMRLNDGRAELIVAKHRHGPVGEYRLRFDEATAEFGDPPRSEESADPSDPEGY